MGRAHHLINSRRVTRKTFEREKCGAQRFRMRVHFVSKQIVESVVFVTGITAHGAGSFTVKMPHDRNGSPKVDAAKRESGRRTAFDGSHESRRRAQIDPEVLRLQRSSRIKLVETTRSPAASPPLPSPSSPTPFRSGQVTTERYRQPENELLFGRRGVRTIPCERFSLYHRPIRTATPKHPRGPNLNAAFARDGGLHRFRRSIPSNVRRCEIDFRSARWGSLELGRSCRLDSLSRASSPGGR
jgi:hypothetical protein